MIWTKLYRHGEDIWALPHPNHRYTILKLGKWWSPHYNGQRIGLFTDRADAIRDCEHHYGLTTASIINLTEVLCSASQKTSA